VPLLRAALLCSLLSLPGAVRQESAPPSAALRRIEVIGASLTGGFRLRHDLADALRVSLREEPELLASHGDLLFFASPEEKGDRLVEAALAGEPTLVVALDFLFWFGYGLAASEEDRLERLEVGLEMLDQLECPLIVGDFPDMSDAVGKMIRPAQMPAQETLVALSARVHAWAAERERVIVLPLAELVTALRSDEPVRMGRHEWPAGSTDRLLQRDRLHPTLEGMLGVTLAVDELLVRAKLAREEDFRFDLPALLTELRATGEGGGR